jgi:hypothetical protein
MARLKIAGEICRGDILCGDSICARPASACGWTRVLSSTGAQCGGAECGLMVFKGKFGF